MERRTERRSRRGIGRTGGSRAARLAAFTAAAGIMLVYALRGRGSYDSVVFQEHGLVIWWVLALGFALGLLPRFRPSRSALLLLASLAAYAVWTAISLIWSESAELTSQELTRSLDVLGVATLAVTALDRDTWRSAAAGIGLAALLVCVVAVGSRLAPSVFGADHLDAVLHIDRLSRPFGYWNAVAAWGAMCAAFGLTFSAHDTVRARRVLVLALVPVAALMTYLTYSRAGAGGITLAAVAAVALSRNRLTAAVHLAAAAGGTALAIIAVRHAPEVAHATGTNGAGRVALALGGACALCGLVALATSFARIDRWRLPRRLSRPLAIAFGIVVLVLAGVFGPRLASRGWHSFTRTQPIASSADPTARLANLSGTRYPIWRSAIHAFDAHPLDGIGAGAWQFWWNRHATDSEFVRDAHNLWLENMAELGMPGLLLIIAVAASALWVGFAARRRTRRRTSAGAAAALLSVFIVYLLHASVDWMWESTAVTVLALGAIAILATRLSREPLTLRLPVRAILALLAALAAIVQLPGLLSTTAIRHSQRAERAGNATLAFAWARQAVRAEPWSASAYEQRALVLESAGRFRPAAEDLNRAISREPTNYSHWFLLSRVETELGKFRLARRDYTRAHALRPRASVFAVGLPVKQP